MFKRIINKFRKNVYEEKHCVIANEVEIIESDISEYCNLAHHSSIMYSEIGKRTSIGRYSKIRDSKIGAYCSISFDVIIGAVSHPMDFISTHAFTYRKQFDIVEEDIMLKHPITNIGNDVWIGCGAIILSGVTIGDGAIIGAGAVVTKDVEPYTIVAGVPAKVLKTRFEKEISDKLIKLKWWELEDEKLKKAIKLFQKPITNDDIRYLEEMKKEGERK